MHNYAILYNPGHNRVYYKESLRLSLSELKIAASRLSSQCTNIKNTQIQGTPYCTFDMSERLNQNDIRILSGLSFLFVLFEAVTQNGEPCFIPINAEKPAYVDEKITTILKYKGKTNELFTKMMVNIAHLCSNASQKPKLLDPLSGKGTTLYEGMVQGFDVYGIELSKQSAHEGCVFIKKYFERERYKHISSNRTITNAVKKSIGKGCRFDYAKNKDDFKNGDTHKIEMIHGDASFAERFYKKSYFDMIVLDLPYGVQHASKNSHAKGSLKRSPELLLQRCLPCWHSVLKKDGVMVIANNVRVLSKDKAFSLLQNAGFTVLHKDIPFGHYVDVAIQRDIIIAKK